MQVLLIFISHCDLNIHTDTTYKLVRNKIDNYFKENSKEHRFRVLRNAYTENRRAANNLFKCN